MKVDGGIGNQLDKVGAQAADLERTGYSGGWTAETSHDPFLPLLLAAEHTSELELGTSIAVAFARNPMTLANLAWDLQAYSKGRFILGLGSQIKPHITKRFSMEWSHPAPRMREMVLAIRAIWDTWLHGTPLQFRGDFYTHTLMTPFFTPDASDLEGFGVPKVFLAGVGALMTEVAGEVCDGFLCHGFTTERYLREVTIPALERGRAKAGKTMDGFQLVGPSFVVTGTTDEDLDAAAAGTDDDAYLGALDEALAAVDAADPAVVVVSLGVDTYAGDPMCDLALTTGGFARCGAAVAALDRPLVILQEGGYADEALGANVRSWLTGAAAAR